MEEDEAILTQQLLERLKGRGAHMPFEEATKDFPMDRINEPFPNGTYSSWALIEHLRIAQWDILDFIRNPGYQYMEWPKDYWPEPEKQATPEEWQETVGRFHADRAALEELAQDPETDLYARIPWGEGQTALREFLIVADHNAYHIGEFAIMRQVMGTWNQDPPRG
jgi:hypothetical protein